MVSIIRVKEKWSTRTFNVWSFAMASLCMRWLWEVWFTSEADMLNHKTRHRKTFPSIEWRWSVIDFDLRWIQATHLIIDELANINETLWFLERNLSVKDNPHDGI